eukprot:7242917-Lingulodinium_polyedra.AAC.1
MSFFVAGRCKLSNASRGAEVFPEAFSQRWALNAVAVRRRTLPAGPAAQPRGSQAALPSPAA